MLSYRLKRTHASQVRKRSATAPGAQSFHHMNHRIPIPSRTIYRNPMSPLMPVVARGSIRSPKGDHLKKRLKVRRDSLIQMAMELKLFDMRRVPTEPPASDAALARRVAFRPSNLQDPETAGGSYENGYLHMNVGGKSYVVRMELFTHERTLMHDIISSTHEERLKLVDDYNESADEYYMERNNRVSEHIMDFYATGSLHKPQGICTDRFKEELAFWRISHDHLSACCTFPHESHPSSARTVRQTSFNEEDTKMEFDGAVLSDTRWKIWRFLEYPQSSHAAAAFALASMMFVAASVIGLILGSMPEWQEDSSQAHFYHLMHVKRAPDTSKFEENYVTAPPTAPNSSGFVYKATDNPCMALVVLEWICIVWFTFELTIRFLIFPRKGEFCKKTLNIVDLLTILPFYLELCLPLLGVESRLKEFSGDDTSLSRRAQTVMGAMLVVRVLRVLRMARVFKLARYSTSLQTFGHTLHSSITELTMLGMFLLTGIIFFSTIMYYLESNEPHTDFYSIPAGCWWCVVTMATVGYGDAKPITFLGKLVATATCICGIIVLAFPISMIVEKFASAQQRALEEEQLQQAQMSAVANNYLLKRFPTRRRVRRPTS